MLTLIGLTVLLLGVGFVALVLGLVVGALKLAFHLLGAIFSLGFSLIGLCVGLLFGLLMLPLLPLAMLAGFVWLVARALRPAPVYRPV